MGKGSRNRKQREENPSGCKLSSTQRKLLEDEVRRELLRQEHQLSMEVDAAWLWQLFMRYDWSVEELHRIYKDMEADHNEIRKHYDLAGNDGAGWLYVQKLRDAGVDLEKWYAE